MLITDKIVYLQLQKTGSTFLGEALHVGLDAEQVGKHQPPTATQRQEFADRLVFGSVRHPFDWYVSLWGFSCSGRGELYDRTAGSAWRHVASVIVKRQEPEFVALAREFRRDRTDWLRLYRDVDDVGAFRGWLELIHSPTGAQRWAPGLMGTTLLADQGLYSHWYRRCFSWWHHPLKRKAAKAHSPTGELATQKLVRLEHVATDVATVLRAAGYDDAAVDRVHAAAGAAFRNPSRRGSTQKYWDSASKAQIMQLDRLVFDAASYTDDSTDFRKVD